MGHAATTQDSSHYTKGAPGTYTSRRGAAFQPRCREGRWSDCRRCSGVPRVRAVSLPRIELSSTLAARALRPPARPPATHRPARRPRRAAARAARALRAARRRRGEPALPRLSRPLVRACGVLAWRRRSGLSGKGRSCADGAMPWGPPGSLCLHLCRVEQGWRPPRSSRAQAAADAVAQMVQVTTAAYQHMRVLYESDEPSANNMTERLSHRAKRLSQKIEPIT